MPVLVRAAPGANHDALTLDVVEQQILIGFPLDHFPYHQRLLLIQIGPGRWIVCTPTWDVHAHDLTEEDVMPLGRNVGFPAAGRPFFAFGAPTEEQLRDMRSRAMALARVLGVSDPKLPTAVTDAQWYYADPALAEFGGLIPADSLSSGDGSFQGPVGLVLAPVDGVATWKFAQHVRDADLAQWIAEKRIGLGRDPRLTGLTIDPKHPVILFRDAVADMDRTAPLWMRFAGNSVTVEMVDAMLASGIEPPALATLWEQQSGVNPKSSLAVEHRMLILALWLMACRDRLDLFHSASAEHISRRIIQIEKAVRKSPRAPDFEGLDAYAEHIKDGAGVLVTPQFDQHVAQRQKTENFLLKQQRQAREEATSLATAAKAKAKAKGKGGGKGDTEE